ncbi:MAG: B12-binding domain-containing radical SAM protein [Chloroflexi bacterium]|nr:B12-binding domain-containing radical SAM protein [Chloroflexota bacterium]
MTSVLLIFPYFNRQRHSSIFRFPPLGLGYLAAALRQAGHEVSLLDCTFMERQDAFDQAARTNADVVGIYSMVTMRAEALSFARHLRSRAGLLVAGGPQPTGDPAAFLDDFDVVVRGEGEHTLLELLDAYEGKRDPKTIDGIAYRESPYAAGNGRGKVVLTAPRRTEASPDRFAFPARDLFPNRAYIDYYRRQSGNATTSVVTTRGCPFTCEYCSNAVFGVSYRERSAAHVIAEVEQALALGYNRIHFADDVFTLRKERVRQICAEIKSRGLRFQWECLARVDSINDDIARTMKDAGCDRIFFGIESANDWVLEMMKKRISAAQAQRAVEAAHRAGLRAGAFFILCYPGEDNDSVLRTLRFATSLPLSYLSFTMPYPLPGTALFERVKGRITKEWVQDSRVTDHSLIFDADFSQAKMRFAILKGQAQFGMRRRLGKYAGIVEKPFEVVTDAIFRTMR